MEDLEQQLRTIAKTLYIPALAILIVLLTAIGNMYGGLISTALGLLLGVCIAIISLASRAPTPVTHDDFGMTSLESAPATILLPSGAQVLTSTANTANTQEIIRGDVDELLEAILNNEVEKVKNLIKFGLDLNTPNRHGVVPIALAKQLGNQEIIALHK